MGKWFWVRAFLVAAVWPSSVTAEMSAEPCQLTEGPVAHVAQVIDGETVQLADGAELRLLTVLAAKTSADALENLLQGRDVQPLFR